jgi:hypothetical protein
MWMEVWEAGAEAIADRICAFSEAEWAIAPSRQPRALGGFRLDLPDFEPEALHPMVAQSTRKYREAQMAQLVVEARAVTPDLQVKMYLRNATVPDDPQPATQEEMDEAVVKLSDAFRMFIDMGDMRQIADTAGFLGNVLASGNLFDEAVFFFKKAYEVYTRLDDEERAGATLMFITALESEL